MKKKVVTLILPLTLLVITIVSIQFVNLTKANFKPGSPPQITIFSPSPNQVYNSSKVLLDVSADPFGGYPNPIAYNNITSLNYSLDGQQDIPIPIGRSMSGIVLHETSTLSNLSNGPHSVFIHGESTPYSVVPGCSEKIPFNVTVSFTVELPTTRVAEPFPTVPVLIASVGIVTIVSAGLLVYFKKRRVEAGNQEVK